MILNLKIIKLTMYMQSNNENGAIENKLMHETRQNVTVFFFNGHIFGYINTL